MRKINYLIFHASEGKSYLYLSILILCCCCLNYSATASDKTNGSNANTTITSKTLNNSNLPLENLLNCSITGNLSFCAGGSTQLCAPAGQSTYLWSNGASTQCISVTSAGNYSVSYSDVNGTTVCNVNVILDVPNCSIKGDNYFCYGGSTTINGEPGYASYLWSTGATTQYITVTTAGTYTLTVTNSNGCSSSCSKNVIANPLPNCTITGGNFCPGGSSQLCAPAGVGAYLWSTGVTTQCITVNTPGIYTVTVTDANGCSQSCSKSVTYYTPPSCSISGSLFYCLGSSTQICAPAGLASYIWNTGATTQCITVTQGDYTVTVTDGNGCTSSCTAKVTVRQLPACSITGNTSICPGTSTQWCAAIAPVGSTYSYAWSTGATTQCITVSTAATYTVTITNQYGCSSSCSKTLTLKALPTCTITGNGSICPGGSTQWCAPAGLAFYLWSTGATTQCITVSASGTYYVTVTSTNGCTKSCSKSLTLYTIPTCAITGTLSYCQGGSTIICASLNTAYLWNTGATTQCITATAGDYTVTVTNANGCTNSCTVKVIEHPNPSCSITGNSAICQGASTQWCAASGAASYSWGTGATTQCITVSTAGTYTVTVTDQYGCTSSCSKTLTTYTPPTCLLPGTTIACTNNLPSQLCAPLGFAGYLWSNGITDRCFGVSTPGIYTVTVTDANGCTGSCTTNVITSLPPNCTITGNLFYCQGGNTQICSSGGLVTYLWSTGATTQCITVTAGDYTVTVTDANGCTSSCTTKVTERPNPICSITGNGSV
ncbi:MAG: hypothetical protein ABI723_13440, partial [Bacteroidia bacterium]